MDLDTPAVSRIYSLTVPALRANWFYGQHLHPYYQVHAVLQGELRYQIGNDRKLRLRAGDALLLPPMVWHRYEWAGTPRIGSIKFQITPRFWPDFCGCVRLFRLARGVGERLTESAARLVTDEPLARQEAMALATLCLHDSLRGRVLARLPSKQLDPFVAKLQPWIVRVTTQPFEKWTVAAVAKACHVSSDYLCRRFHGLYGSSPHEFLLEARMWAAATELTKMPSRPIKEIAEDAHYTSVHTFSRAFKQVMGVSPGTYRRERLT
jgi:AraC-like DNA-binding protein